MHIFFILIFTSILGFAKDIVTCEFRGQMGNQMWTIAAVVAHALEYDYEPVFPELKEALGGEFNYRHFFHRLNVSSLSNNEKFHVFTESHSHKYSPIPHSKGENLRLVGHFESPQYFEKHSQTIRELFAPTSEILDEIYGKYGDLLKEPTVAIHVRTYIPDGRDPHNNIGGASWNYFKTAMQYFPENAHFVIFSDSIEWTKNYFPADGRRISFIEGNARHIDFYLMSLCNHVIVSPESTFSWWAAWLNQSPNKIVIVADEWGGLIDNDTIPVGWIKISKRPN